MASPITPTDNSMQQIHAESQAFTTSFYDDALFVSSSAPEIYGNHTFDFHNKLDILSLAESLASEAKYLINEVEAIQLPNTDRQFQMELRKINIQDDNCLTYKMSLRIDSVFWFKGHPLHGGNVQDLDNLYKVASDYVEKVKNETEHYPRILNEHEIYRIPVSRSNRKWCHIDRKGETCHRYERYLCNDKHYQWCDGENYGPTGKCTTKHYTLDVIHTPKIRKEEIPGYLCRYSSLKLNRTYALCRFYVDPDFWIYADSVSKPSFYPYFIVAARYDATPVITLNPVKHCKNEEYVQTSDAWQAVLKTLRYIKDQVKMDTLPLSRIYINFGKWMQQKVDDSSCRHAHAHINIVLTRQTIEKINEINLPEDKQHKPRELFQSLVGSILPPKTHRLDDSLQLIEHMNNHMTPLLIKRNQKLERSVSILKAELEALKEENKYFRNLTFGPTYTAQETEDTAQGTDADDFGTGVNEKDFETGINEEGPETRINEEDFETRINEEGSETTINEEGFETRINEEGSETRINEEGSETTINEEDFETRINEEGSETRINEEGLP
ncbi:unnamed protein product [Adineta steineri]|uniref:Uncharacterized protein n=1 Tax=Adineta steineri TaxID=433720 RepID=A0A813WE46_9BILA|nr:unnamed protein product [Adineta steineri]CAF4072788.1 unnamed protein product [Adineta steineri]